MIIMHKISYFFISLEKCYKGYVLSKIDFSGFKGKTLHIIYVRDNMWNQSDIKLKS